MENEFSVYQFFIDGSYEAVRRFVVMEEAAKAFTHYATSVGVTLGFVTRVIITDGGDNTVAEWTRHDGVTWPPELAAEIKAHQVKLHEQNEQLKKDLIPGDQK